MPHGNLWTQTSWQLVDIKQLVFSAVLGQKLNSLTRKQRKSSGQCQQAIPIGRPIGLHKSGFPDLGVPRAQVSRPSVATHESALMRPRRGAMGSSCFGSLGAKKFRNRPLAPSGCQIRRMQNGEIPLWWFPKIGLPPVLIHCFGGFSPPKKKTASYWGTPMVWKAPLKVQLDPEAQSPSGNGQGSHC